MSDTTDFTVTLDGPRLARARHAASHMTRTLCADRDHAAFVADLALASPLTLAAWLSGRALVWFQAETPAAGAMAAEAAAARVEAERDLEPDPVRVVPAARSSILPAIGVALARSMQLRRAHEVSAALFEGAQMPEDAEAQRARARGMDWLHRELWGLYNTESWIEQWGPGESGAAS